MYFISYFMGHLIPKAIANLSVYGYLKKKDIPGNKTVLFFFTIKTKCPLK